ncbi:MAG: tyrosine-protein phosphatase [Solirubrobacterales bacterium]
MIDLHCHVLAGIDDGAATVEDSVALARCARDRGIETIVATPHVSWHYDNGAETIARLVAQTNAAFDAAGVGVSVVAGAEIAMTRAVDLRDEELAKLTLGGGRWLLLECPFSSSIAGLDSLALDLQDEGYGVVLAHPERCPAFASDPIVLESLVRAGVLTSITAGSLIGRFGGTVARFANELMEAELVHNVASDAHDLERRQPGMAAELEQAGFAALTSWLAQDVPAAILSGAEGIPPRPHVTIRAARPPRPRRWWRRGLLKQAS